jgi:hypothetical protein
MKEATKRSMIRWIHTIFGIPILGYVYLAAFGAVDVERTCRSTASFDENENGTIGGLANESIGTD